MFTVDLGGHGATSDDRARFTAPPLAVPTRFVRGSRLASADRGASAIGAAAIGATSVAWRLAQRTLVKRHTGSTSAYGFAPGTAPGWFA